MASHSTGDGGIPPRSANKMPTRVMTLGGAYGTRNFTVKDLEIKRVNVFWSRPCHLQPMKHQRQKRLV